jgi:hypothetical protein
MLSRKADRKSEGFKKKKESKKEEVEPSVPEEGFNSLVVLTKVQDEPQEDGAAAPAEKKNKVPQNHKEQKDLRVKRKLSSNPSFVIISGLKKLWEEGRQKTCTTERRGKIVKEMLVELEGKMREVRR